MPRHDEPTWIELADGTRRILGPEEILPDGARFARPLSLRDARANGSGSGLFMTDAERARAEGERDTSWLHMVDRMTSAWKQPDGQRRATVDRQRPQTAIDAALARDQASYREKVERHATAWRRPA